MKRPAALAKRRPKLTSALLWVLVGPTYPLEGSLETAQGPVQFKFLRSENIGTDLKIMLLDPVPAGVTGYIALVLNRGERRNRLSVYLAGIVTLLVYFIPHSIFGSEYDYRTGTGHGTAG